MKCEKEVLAYCLCAECRGLTPLESKKKKVFEAEVAIETNRIIEQTTTAVGVVMLGRLAVKHRTNSLTKAVELEAIERVENANF